MRDIDAPVQYTQGNEAEYRREVNGALDRCYASGRDIFIVEAQRLCLQSPNGTWHKLKVDDAGVLSTEVVSP